MFWNAKTIFRIKIPIKKVKTTMYKILFRPIALYVFKKLRPSTKTYRKKLVILARKILRQIFGPKKNLEIN